MIGLHVFSKHDIFSQLVMALTMKFMIYGDKVSVVIQSVLTI